MNHISRKLLGLVGLTALTLSGTAALTSAPAEAQSRGGYILDEDDGDALDRPRVQRRVVQDHEDELPLTNRRIAVEEDDDAPRVQRQIVERHITERRIVEPVVQRRVVVRQVVQPVVERRIVEPRRVARQAIERPVILAVARPVVERRIVQPVVERRIVRVAAPVEECQTVVTRRTNAFGDRVVTRSRSCD